MAKACWGEGVCILGENGVGQTSTIHVNQAAIRNNQSTQAFDPVITVRAPNGREVEAHEVRLVDHNGDVVAHIVYRPHSPLDGGATVWIETECQVQPLVREDTSRKPDRFVAE